ncbi:phage tail protein [Aeromonas jandaei]|uniref:phage tail-collar fiber domain-containing protein n=1 Tax=Aeromonas jandaei TaxID=650 RepID=UPI001F489B84|nr:phage tail protein [Aeromonas jandaei]
MSQIITNAFSHYWQECLANQTPVVLDEFVLANVPDLDPTSPINPDSGLPPAGQIVHRHKVDQRGRINNDSVAYTIVMDTTVGDFGFNAMYLINKATGVVGMIVHKGLETKLKTDEAAGQTGNSLVKSMLMEYDRAAEATATHVDASTWQIDYAARLRGMDDDLRLQALQFFGPATFYGDGFKLVNESGVYKVQPGVAYVGGLRAELNEVKKITPGAKPVGLWLDIYRAGALLDAWVNHFTLTLSVPDMVDYLDSNGYQHHVAKVAIINADGSVTDVRRKRTIELTGDVTGKGILEDAKGVTIAVEIKDGSHRHKWGDLDDVPELALKRHRHPWENIDEVPAGLGTYAAATTNVATQLRAANKTKLIRTMPIPT